MRSFQKLGAIAAAGALLISLNACSGLASGVSSRVSSTAADSEVLSNLTNAKVAISAYEAVKGHLPTQLSDSVLRDYGWSKATGVRSVEYKMGTAANAGKFCIIATGTTGSSMVVSSNSDAAAGSTCPASY